LSAKDIAELLQFARIGYRRGLERRVGELAAANGSGPVLASLSSHLAQFNLAGLIAMLEEMELGLDGLEVAPPPTAMTIKEPEVSDAGI
jgi:hypothetical protein